MHQTDPLLGPLESDEHREMCGVQVDVARAGAARVKRPDQCAFRGRLRRGVQGAEVRSSRARARRLGGGR